MTGAIGLAGSAMQSSAAAKQADKQYSNDMATARMQRQWNVEDRDEAREYSRQVYQNLIEDSEAAGINPLTALRSGGGANYNAAAGFAPLSRQAPTRQAPLGAGAHIGDFLQNFDPFRDAARMDGARLIDAQVANLEANTAATLAQTAQVEFRPSGRAGSLSGANGSTLKLSGRPQSPVMGDAPTITNPHVKALVDPTVPDATAAGDRYGEPGEYPAAYRNARADLKKNLQENPAVVLRTFNEFMRDMSTGGFPSYLIETYGKPILARRRQNQQRNENRKQKMRRDAARNFRDLGFN